MMPSMGTFFFHSDRMLMLMVDDLAESLTITNESTGKSVTLPPGDFQVGVLSVPDEDATTASLRLEMAGRTQRATASWQQPTPAQPQSKPKRGRKK